MNEFVFKTPPMQHQLVALARSYDEPFWAYLMEQGTGKSKVVIDRAQTLYLHNKILALLILAPNGVHANWVNEQMAVHFREDLMPDSSMAIFRSGAGSKKYQAAIEDLFRKRECPGLVVLSMNLEALPSSNSAQALANRFLKHFAGRSMLALDESSTIKTPSAKTTRIAQALGRLATYRCILTGTEITQGPLDLYAQFQFLYPGLLGAPNFAAFKAHYAEWRERIVGQPGHQHRFQELVRYRNLEELKARVSKHSFQIRKKDCLDLPEKVHITRPVVLGAEQRATYNAVRQRVLAELEMDAKTETITTAHVLTKSIRLQQIAGGFAKMDDGKMKVLPNAKLNSLEALLEEIPGDAQVIIWARFVAELQAIVEMLGDQHCARYWGEIDKKLRAAYADEFKAGKRRFMVAQQRAGGKGHTWIAGTYVVYFSNTFSWEDRSQSEDRAHRIGQTENVTYIDLVAEDTLDERIVKALKFKKDVAEFFKGSSMQELL